MPDIRILHVDDEPDVRLLVEASLGLDPGLVTQSCASGAEALAIAAQWRPDLILLDATMPDMDGPATLAQLKDDARTSGIRVIFLTASCQDNDVDRFRSIGSDGVIAKPFDPRALAAAVRSHVQPGEAEPPAAPTDPTFGAPAGAGAVDPGPSGHAVAATGLSMGPGLGAATSATPGDAGGLVLFDANGHPLTLGLGEAWDMPRLQLETVAGGPFGTPATFTGGHHILAVSQWGSGTMPDAAGAVTLLDIDPGQAAAMGASVPADLHVGAIGPGSGGIGDHASGYHAAVDRVHAVSFDRQGGGEAFAGGLTGSDVWATMLHEPRILASS